jgi:hypothetical protein
MKMPQQPKKADRSAWPIAAVGAAGALVGALTTGTFNYFSHQGDLDAKMIELSVGSLRADPTPETEPLRAWAIGTMEKRAKLTFTDAQRSALLTKKLPFTFTVGPALRELGRLSKGARWD